MKSFKQFISEDAIAKKLALADIEKAFKLLRGIEISIDEGGFDKSQRAEAMKELTAIDKGMVKLRKIATKLKG